MGRLNRQLESHSGAIQEANANLGIQIRQLKALHDAGQAITSSLDLNTTLEVILRTTAGIVNSSTSAVNLARSLPQVSRKHWLASLIPSGHVSL